MFEKNPLVSTSPYTDAVCSLIGLLADKITEWDRHVRMRAKVPLSNPERHPRKP